MTSNISELRLVVISFGKILYTSSTPVFFHTSSSISFKSTEEMFPLVDVLVYYVSESGEIVSDDLRVRFENKAQNKVSFDSFIFSISFLFVMKIITITHQHIGTGV